VEVNCLNLDKLPGSFFVNEQPGYKAKYRQEVVLVSQSKKLPLHLVLLLYAHKKDEEYCSTLITT